MVMHISKRKNSHYLQHSFKKNGKTVTREKYLGVKIPKNIEIIEKELLVACRKEAFYDTFDIIKKQFQKEWQKLPESIKEKMIEEYSINFTYNTNAIEGSTISEEETRELISHKIAPNKPIREVQETQKHAELFKTILEKKDLKIITKNTLLEWHKTLFSETKPDIAGQFREYLVRVGTYRAPDWQDLSKLITILFKFFNEENKFHPVEFAARFHYRFEKIHPFGDGNGRIGRLLMNHMLWKNNYPLLVIEYKKRKSYYKALEKDEEEFVQYFIRRYLASHKKYLKEK